MIQRGKRSVLGVLVDAVDYEGAVAFIRDAALAARPFAVTALAVHGVMTGYQDPAHRTRLNRFDLVVPDGQPVRWALDLLHGVGLPDRVYGPRLTLETCEMAAREGLGLYLYGSTPETNARLAEALPRRFPGLVVSGAEPSAFRRLTADERADVVARIRASGARITLVGLGCPRQEVWVYEYREALSMPCLAVGAAFDFHAGTLAQAPSWMQDAGLEWLFRLGAEPRRLWKRYAVLNPWFAGLVAAQAAGRRFATDGPEPQVESYG